MNKDKVERLPKSEAIIHAFLPTEDSYGLGVVVMAILVQILLEDILSWMRQQ